MENPQSPIRYSEIFGTSPYPPLSSGVLERGNDEYLQARNAGVVPSGLFHRYLFENGTTHGALEKIAEEDIPPAEVDGIQRLLQMPPAPAISKRVWVECKNNPETLAELQTSLLAAYAHAESTGKQLHDSSIDEYEAVQRQYEIMLESLRAIDDAQRGETGQALNTRGTMVAWGIREYVQRIVEGRAFIENAVIGLQARENLPQAIRYTNEAPRIDTSRESAESTPLASELDRIERESVAQKSHTKRRL